MTARLAANDEPPMAERRAAGAETTPQGIAYEATKTTKGACRSADGPSASVVRDLRARRPFSAVTFAAGSSGVLEASGPWHSETPRSGRKVSSAEALRPFAFSALK